MQSVVLLVLEGPSAKTPRTKGGSAISAHSSIQTHFFRSYFSPRSRQYVINGTSVSKLSTRVDPGWRNHGLNGFLSACNR